MSDDDQTQKRERERVARLVDHILRVAKPGDELHDEITYGPETEDTTTWILTKDGGIEMWGDTVYPAMARLPSQLLRTFTPAEARIELIERIDADRVAWTKKGDKNFMAGREKRWGMTSDDG